MPVASGSSVPAWPTFAALKSRLIAATAPAEDSPSGLSSTSQPSTLSPLRFLAIFVQVAAHHGITQDGVDALGIVERSIGGKGDFGCAPQLHRFDDFAAQVRGRALERLQQLRHVAATER